MYNILHLCVSATSVTTATLSFISLPFLRHPCVCDQAQPVAVQRAEGREEPAGQVSGSFRGS